MKNEGAVDIRPCTIDDLEGSFHPPIKSEEETAQIFFPLMFCLESEVDIKLQGSHTSSHQQYFTVGVARCVETEGESEKKCKDVEEINALLEYSSLIYFYNTQTYRSNKYGEQTVSNESKLDYFPLKSHVSTV